MQYNAKDQEINFAQAYAVMCRSQTKLAQQQEEAEKKLDVPQMSVTIAKRGTPLPSLPNDLAKNQLSADQTILASTFLKSNMPKSQAKIFNSSLANSFQAFDIIDHAKKSKIQMSELEYLQAYPNQLDRLAKFVKESQLTQTHLVNPKVKNVPSNLVTIPSSVPGKIEPFLSFSFGQWF